MKKVILVSAIILLPSLVTLVDNISSPLGRQGGATCFAQQYIPFPTDSAQWSVRHSQNNPFSQTPFQYKMKGDTLLNGILYHKIYSSPDLDYYSPDQTLHCFLREDTTKKVFVKYPTGLGIDTAEFMLYNFNLAVGDTVTVRMLYPTDSLFKLVVTNVDSAHFLNGYRKYTGLKPVVPIMWGQGCDVTSSWTDGIGSNLNFLYNEIPVWTCAYGGRYDLVCFWHKGVYVTGGSYCDYYYLGIDEIKIDGNLQVYPNPINDAINIVFNDSEATSGLVEIQDILGQLLYSESLKPVSGKLSKSIDLSMFSDGVYFLKVKTEDKILSAKFVKQ